MAKQPEARLTERIRKSLKREVGGWWFKVWGGPFQRAGVPDLVGCVEGLFFGLEVKTTRRGSEPSKLQEETMKDIREAGGVSCVVRSPQEAVDVVTQALAEAKRGL